MSKASIESLKRSWGETGRRSRSPQGSGSAGKSPTASPPAQVPAPIQTAPTTTSAPAPKPSKKRSPPRTEKVLVTATDMQDVEPAGSPPSSPKRKEISHTAAPRASSPRRAHSPKRAASGGFSDQTVDPGTQCVATIPDCDARCTLLVNGELWVGERDGTITIRHADGEVFHIIERRKGAFISSLVLVGEKAVWAGCTDGFIRVLDVTSFKMVHQFARHGGGGGGVHVMAYHSPSKTVFSGGNDFEVLSWNAETHDFIQQLPLKAGVKALATDIHWLYSGSDDGAVTVFEIRSGTKLQTWTGHTKGVVSLVLTESHVWSGSEDSTIRIWNKGDLVAVAEVHTGAVSALTVVGDKVWSGAGDTLCLWDANRLQLLGTYVAHDGYMNSITISGKTVQHKVWTTASDKVAKVWSTETDGDETGVLKRELERLRATEYNNSLLQAQLAEKDARIAELEGRLAASDAEVQRLKGVEAENERLRAELEEQANALARLTAQLAESEARGDALAHKVDSLERVVADLTSANGRLEAALADATAEVERLRAQLQATVEHYEGKLSEAQAEIARLTNANRELEEQANRWRAEAEAAAQELAKAQAEVARLSQQLEELAASYEQRLAALQQDNTRLNTENHQLKLALDEALANNRLLEAKIAELQKQIDDQAALIAEMDIIFKSRLSLITDVFGIFKKSEANEKKFRGDPREVKEPHHAMIVDFRGVIGRHYTDDELAHLGSSRHFFPTDGSRRSPTKTSP